VATIDGGVLVDSNVLLDVVRQDPQWSAWSTAMMVEVAGASRLIINPIIYGEVSVRYATIEDLDVALPPERFVRENIPYEAAFLAGKAYLLYRKRGGTRTSPLPDFLIGAHAAISGHRLLTRDPVRYRSYFPKLDLIAP
jgi:predicted nucleic acid-binding protein